MEPLVIQIKSEIVGDIGQVEIVDVNKKVIFKYLWALDECTIYEGSLLDERFIKIAESIHKASRII